MASVTTFVVIIDQKVVANKLRQQYYVIADIDDEKSWRICADVIAKMLPKMKVDNNKSNNNLKKYRRLFKDTLLTTVF